mmetsp:Transcript_39556/g.79884  ORF Transcript_39556/g.79884 Transcript_39556/m.79884 type:complete len:410 (-) Transcript_39556:107-1336(-)|eukprot:CAMPEP_0171752980 /NCGR_PEP_ID=MMETSP0991-20121206/42953_1 /TAXON_ID=483369 /ORGANISM="non described non described, Strain CCMP2098" /LENGTH=409 /DNA_ID=CAMNT_0012354495 /DNA_START=64 /DNA_END=1293 /DNA_ORIENTATION=-
MASSLLCRRKAAAVVLFSTLARDSIAYKSYARIRVHGSQWKDDPSWNTPLEGASKDAAIAALSDFIGASKRLLVITGAGVSTASGIPDYRGKEGSYKNGHKPMSHQEFIARESNRQRYWARSLVGFGKFLNGVEPNRCHTAISLLEAAGRVQHIITQNVDGLHSKAGSVGVTDLHGRIDRVRCMGCGNVEARASVQARMMAENAEWARRWTSLSTEDGSGLGGRHVKQETEQQQADGDAELVEGADYLSFKVPRCLCCGGQGNEHGNDIGPDHAILKPDVVFFGDNVPKNIVDHALVQVDESDAVLIVGSSLEVFSAYRFVLRACHKDTAQISVEPHLESGSDGLNEENNLPPTSTGKKGTLLCPTKPLCILNLGETRAERSRVEPLLKIHLPCEEALWEVVTREGLVS